MRFIHTLNEEEAFKNLLEKIESSGKLYNGIVTVGRGGLSLAQKLGYKLNIKVKQLDSLELTHDLLFKHWLFVDDIACTGETANSVWPYLDVAVLVKRSGAERNKGTMYYGVEYTGEKYVAFSWENYDTGDKPGLSFREERSRTGEDSLRYGKDIIQNFSVPEDLILWDIDNKYDQLVSFEHPEVIGRCPVSGFPDTYTAKFSFVPDKHTLELKAFKLWLNSYIDKQISHEYLAQEIFTIFWEHVKPKYLKVLLHPAPRGNITTVIKVEKGVLDGSN